MHLRAFTPADADAMHALHAHAVRTTCRSAYTLAEVEAWLSGRSPEGYIRAATQKGEIFTIAEENTQIVGFSSWKPCENGTEAELASLYLHPEHQGKGRGKALFTAADEGARAAGFSGITRLNAALNARLFYSKLGFETQSLDFSVKQGIKIPEFIMARPPQP